MRDGIAHEMPRRKRGKQKAEPEPAGVFNLLDEDALYSVLASLDVPSLRNIKACDSRLCAAGRAVLCGPLHATRRTLALRQDEVARVQKKPRGAVKAWLTHDGYDLELMVERRGHVTPDTRSQPRELPIVKWLMGETDGTRRVEDMVGIQDWDDLYLMTAIFCVMDGWIKEAHTGSDLNDSDDEEDWDKTELFERFFRMMSLWDEENIQKKSRRLLLELDDTFSLLDGLFRIQTDEFDVDNPPLEVGLNFLVHKLDANKALVVETLHAAMQQYGSFDHNGLWDNRILIRMLPCEVRLFNAVNRVERLEYIGLLDAAINVTDALQAMLDVQVHTAFEIGKVLRLWADNTCTVAPQEFVDALVSFAFDFGKRCLEDASERVDVLEGFKERPRKNEKAMLIKLTARDSPRNREALARTLLDDLDKAADHMTAGSKARGEEVASAAGAWSSYPNGKKIVHRAPPPRVDNGEDSESVFDNREDSDSESV